MATTLGSLPRKVDGLHTRVVGDEVIVLNEATQTAHVLQGPAAALWRALDNGEWPVGASDSHRQAAQELVEAGLVHTAGLSRRRMLVHGGAAVAAGTVLSMSLPSVAAAQSAPTVGTTTTVTVSSTAPPSGSAVTLSVTVTANSGTAAPTGSVTLTRSGTGSISPDATQTLSSTGTATFTATAGPAGVEETFTATFTPGPGFQLSTGTVKITPVAAEKPKPTVLVTFPPSTPAVGQTVEVTVTVTGTTANGSPPGKVTLVNNDTTDVGTLDLVGEANAAATAKFQLGNGGNPTSLVATYNPAPNSQYATNKSDAKTVTYTAVQPTIEFSGISTKKSATYIMTVRVSGAGPKPTGTIVVTHDNQIASATPLDTLADGAQRYTVTNRSGSTAEITASYQPGTNNNYTMRARKAAYALTNAANPEGSVTYTYV